MRGTLKTCLPGTRTSKSAKRSSPYIAAIVSLIAGITSRARRPVGFSVAEINSSSQQTTTDFFWVLSCSVAKDHETRQTRS